MRYTAVITYVILKVFLSPWNAFAKSYTPSECLLVKADTIKRVNIVVVLEELQTRYDSIFKSQSPDLETDKFNDNNNIAAQSKELALVQSPFPESRLSAKAFPSRKPSEKRFKPKGDVLERTAGRSSISNTAPLVSADSHEIYSGVNEPFKAAKTSYMWIGFGLVMAGIILGVVFGRMAFMISVIGCVFLLIAYNI